MRPWGGLCGGNRHFPAPPTWPPHGELLPRGWAQDPGAREPRRPCPSLSLLGEPRRPGAGRVCSFIAKGPGCFGHLSEDPISEMLAVRTATSFWGGGGHNSNLCSRDPAESIKDKGTHPWAPTTCQECGQGHRGGPDHDWVKQGSRGLPGGGDIGGLFLRKNSVGYKIKKAIFQEKLWTEFPLM